VIASCSWAEAGASSDEKFSFANTHPPPCTKINQLFLLFLVSIQFRFQIPSLIYCQVNKKVNSTLFCKLATSNLQAHTFLKCWARHFGISCVLFLIYLLRLDTAQNCCAMNLFVKPSRYYVLYWHFGKSSALFLKINLRKKWKRRARGGTNEIVIELIIELGYRTKSRVV
jgi:hypothetical protein